jgi:hypothetical protein
LILWILMNYIVYGQSLVTNSALMKRIKNVMLVSLINLRIHRESHELPRNLTMRMILGIEGNVSKSVQVYEVAAHNYFMAK